MSQTEKVCVLCGQSCAGEPRIKDAKGNYAHRACAEQQQKAKQAELAENEALYADESIDDGFGEGMDDLWDDIEPTEAEAGGAASACPGCGTRMEPGVLVCMSCGYNTQSGKAVKTKKRDAKTKSGGSKAASVGVAAGGLALKPILPVLGAVIGGLIGAGVWAFISYQFNIEIGWIAIGVGALCGLGGAIGAGGEGGAITGGMAALVAMGAISMGKYAAVTWQVDDYLGDEYFTPLTLDEIDDELILTYLADDICTDFINAGEAIDWPDPEIYLRSAMWPDDYPQDIIDETWDIWDDMGFTEKMNARRAIADEWDMSSSDVEDDWVMEEIAYGIGLDRIAVDTPIEWDNPLLPFDVSMWPEDYPESIRTQTNERWDAMGSEGQHAFRLGVLDRVNEQRSLSSEFGQEVIKAGFIDSFMHPLDLVFMLLAVMAAFGIASNEA